MEILYTLLSGFLFIRITNGFSSSLSRPVCSLRCLSRRFALTDPSDPIDDTFREKVQEMVKNQELSTKLQEKLREQQDLRNKLLQMLGQPQGDSARLNTTLDEDLVRALKEGDYERGKKEIESTLREIDTLQDSDLTDLLDAEEDTTTVDRKSSLEEVVESTSLPDSDRDMIEIFREKKQEMNRARGFQPQTGNISEEQSDDASSKSSKLSKEAVEATKRELEKYYKAASKGAVEMYIREQNEALQRLADKLLKNDTWTSDVETLIKEMEGKADELASIRSEADFDTVNTTLQGALNEYVKATEALVEAKKERDGILRQLERDPVWQIRTFANKPFYKQAALVSGILLLNRVVYQIIRIATDRDGDINFVIGGSLVVIVLWTIYGLFNSLLPSPQDESKG